MMHSYTDLLQEPPLSPSDFFALVDEGIRGLIRSAVLAAAMEFSLFDLLEKPHEISGIAIETGISEDTLISILGLLCEMSLLEKKADTYRNSRLSSVYLFSGSPFSQESYLRKNAGFMHDIWCRLGGILREGPVEYPRNVFFGEFALPAMAENARCGRLQETVKEISALPGFSGFRRMVDLGGAHGLYAIALTQRNPVLEAYVCDLPHVIPLAEEYISRFGAERVHTIEADFFIDDFGDNYDIILSSSSPSGKSIEILPKIADALNPGGFFVNVQSIGDDEKDIYHALEWKLWTIEGARIKKGRYTKEQPFMTPEYRRALGDAGLAVHRERSIRDYYHAGSEVLMGITKKM